MPAETIGHVWAAAALASHFILEMLLGINVDASFDPDYLWGTTGTIIQDKQGKYIAASNVLSDLVQDVLSAKALALKNGFFLAESIGYNRVVGSPDNLE